MTATGDRPPLCGHTWPGPLCLPPDQRPPLAAGVFHECLLRADHPDDLCRCYCGATTTREETDR